VIALRKVLFPAATTGSRVSLLSPLSRRRRLFAILWSLLSPVAAAAGSDDVPVLAVPAASQVRIVYISRNYDEPPPLSLVEKIVTDQGVQGVRIALDENNRTGRFIGHEYSVLELAAKSSDDVVRLVRERLAGGDVMFVADLEPADLLAVADLPGAKNALILDIRTSEDDLRGANCRANVFHIRPSWAMRADALAQYLLYKKWRRWLLVLGKRPKDLGYAAAVRRAAGRFGGKIVEERTYAFEAGSRRTDTGHQQIQTQMPLLTQSAPQHDVVFVADEGENFGEYLLFRTVEPRPIVGTHGLVAVAWHRAFEEYAAMQMQNRFEKRVGRIMTERDYTGWLAVRIFGEAVTRTGETQFAALRSYLLSDKFEVAGFKGEGMTFRPWDLQLRQPVLLSGPRSLVSVSPQEGFLHPKYLTDSLGVDAPETLCRFEKP